MIAFADSDDLWAETKLEKQVEALQQYPAAGFSMTGGFNFKNIDQPIDFFYKQREGSLYGDIFIRIFKSEISTTTPSLIFRKECLNIVRGFDEAKSFSDIDFILKLAGQFKAVILFEPLLYRRLHSGNDSGRNWIKGYLQGITMIQFYKKKLPLPVVHEALFKLYINFGEDCLLRKKRKMARSNFFRAWSHKPFSIVPLKKTAKAVLQEIINYSGNDSVKISAKPWTKNKPPKRILAIRLQAMGDVTITLPYLQHLRHSLPGTTKLDFLTRKECEDIPKNIFLFDKVISIRGGRNLKIQILYALFLLPRLLWRRYDIVIDLQNNELSEIIRKTIRPAAWSAFDRFSLVAAGERTRLTIEAVGFGKNEISSKVRAGSFANLQKISNGIKQKEPAQTQMASDFHFKNHFDCNAILTKNGWDGISEVVILNPAGAFSTRNWPVENYISFAEIWLNKFPNTQFLVLGTSFIKSKAAFLKRKLCERMISIIGETTPSEAFAIVQKTKFVLSEDSGLMHFAWVLGIPTLVLFGSTRSDWSRPLGERSSFLDSSDLPCGNCMQEICRFNDVHCLTRYSAEFVFKKALLVCKQKISANDLTQSSIRNGVTDE